VNRLGSDISHVVLLLLEVFKLFKEKVRRRKVLEIKKKEKKRKKTKKKKKGIYK
jgi:hypothetical protein